MAALDTTVLVDLLHPNRQRKQQALAKIEALASRSETIATARVDLAELYVGIELSDDPEREYDRAAGTSRNVELILELGRVPLPSRTGRFTAHLRRIGGPAGDMDVLIAAIAPWHTVIAWSRGIRPIFRTSPTSEWRRTEPLTSHARFGRLLGSLP